MRRAWCTTRRHPFPGGCRRGVRGASVPADVGVRRSSSQRHRHTMRLAELTAVTQIWSPGHPTTAEPPALSLPSHVDGHASNHALQSPPPLQPAGEVARVQLRLLLPARIPDRGDAPGQEIAAPGLRLGSVAQAPRRQQGAGQTPLASRTARRRVVPRATAFATRSNWLSMPRFSRGPRQRLGAVPSAGTLAPAGAWARLPIPIASRSVACLPGSARGVRPGSARRRPGAECPRSPGRTRCRCTRRPPRRSSRLPRTVWWIR